MGDYVDIICFHIRRLSTCNPILVRIYKKKRYLYETTTYSSLTGQTEHYASSFSQSYKEGASSEALYFQSNVSPRITTYMKSGELSFQEKEKIASRLKIHFTD